MAAEQATNARRTARTAEYDESTPTKVLVPTAVLPPLTAQDFAATHARFSVSRRFAIIDCAISLAEVRHSKN
jgi:hypothetical protein